jgi:hypothetical protein
MLYDPNNDNTDFFQSLQSKMCLNENTSVIVVSDWNVVQNYDKDTINYQSENNRSQSSSNRVLEHYCYPPASAGIAAKFTNVSPLPKPLICIF